MKKNSKPTDDFINDDNGIVDDDDSNFFKK